MSLVDIKLKLNFEFIPKDQYGLYRGDKQPAVAVLHGCELVSGMLVWDFDHQEYIFETEKVVAPSYIGNWDDIGHHKLWVVKIK